MGSELIAAYVVVEYRALALALSVYELLYLA
jgi:hypothetical protein